MNENFGLRTNFSSESSTAENNSVIPCSPDAEVVSANRLSTKRAVFRLFEFKFKLYFISITQTAQRTYGCVLVGADVGVL